MKTKTRTGVKLLLKGCGSPTESMAEIQIRVSRQVAIAHGKLFWCSIFGRPFVKRFDLCYWTVVRLSCHVCDVGVLCQTVGWTKMLPHLTQSRLGVRPTSIPSDILIRAAIWQQQIWAEIGRLCPFEGEGAGSPSNTSWPGPRSTCTPSFILIHPTVWPQYTNVTDRTD